GLLRWQQSPVRGSTREVGGTPLRLTHPSQCSTRALPTPVGRGGRQRRGRRCCPRRAREACLVGSGGDAPRGRPHTVVPDRFGTTCRPSSLLRQLVEPSQSRDEE